TPRTYFAETSAPSSELPNETKSCQTDEGAIVSALENKLLEYKETPLRKYWYQISRQKLKLCKPD
ncbi:hypothetical protein TELCIR_20665, partial [Teladorsagia circumcincta]